MKSEDVDSGVTKVVDVDDACDSPALVKVTVFVAVEVFPEAMVVVVLGLGSAVGVVAIDVVAGAPHTTLTLLSLNPENHTKTSFITLYLSLHRCKREGVINAGGSRSAWRKPTFLSGRPPYPFTNNQNQTFVITITYI